MGVRERDCRTCELSIIEPAQEVISFTGSCKAASYLNSGPGCSGSHGRSGVGCKAHVQGVGIPLGVEREVSSFAVGVRESNCGAREVSGCEPTKEGVSRPGGCEGRWHRLSGSGRHSCDGRTGVCVESHG